MVIVDLTNVSSSSLDLVVAVESKLKVVFKIKVVVSGSTITGVIEATLNGERAETKLLFCVDVKSCPVVVLIEMKTLPYSGFADTPVLVSKLPSSPPQTDTA